MNLVNKILFLCLCYISLALKAGAIEDLKNFNNNYNSISGSFTEKITNAKSNKTLSGKFDILRPKYFRWEYSSPYKQVIVADGNTIWMYDVDLAQVIKKPQHQTFESTPAEILSNANNLEKNYVLLTEDGMINGIGYVIAKPKNKNSNYSYIKVGIKNKQIISMELKDNFGNNIFITLNNLSYKKLSPKNFRFKIPKNVDLLEN